MELLVWLENTSIANAIRTIPWLYPAFETGHYIGLSLLVGGILLIDLRVLGMARGLPLKTNGAQRTAAGWIGAADPRSEGVAIRE